MIRFYVNLSIPEPIPAKLASKIDEIKENIRFLRTFASKTRTKQESVLLDAYTQKMSADGSLEPKETIQTIEEQL